MLVLRDDAKRDMACRRASRHESRHFHPGLGWIVISMKKRLEALFWV
jgi:hypothetical protein